MKFVAEIKGIAKKERQAAVDKVIELTETGDVAGRGIKKLSRGYLQRVGIAQALLGDPPLLIFDEPTIGLDPMQIISIRNLIKSLGGQRTIILCSHILPEVSQICGRVIIINEGELIAVDTPDNLGRRMKGRGHIIITVEGPADEVTKTLSGVPGVTGVKQAGGEPLRDDLSRPVQGRPGGQARPRKGRRAEQLQADRAQGEGRDARRHLYQTRYGRNGGLTDEKYMGSL